MKILTLGIFAIQFNMFKYVTRSSLYVIDYPTNLLNCLRFVCCCLQMFSRILPKPEKNMKLQSENEIDYSSFLKQILQPDYRCQI